MEIRVAGYRLFNEDPLNYEFAEGAKKFTEEYGTTVEFLVGGKDGMDEQGIAESLGLANPELVERVMYSDNGEQCFLFYANRDLVVVDVLTGQTINTIPDIPKLEWYAGKDEKQNTYILDF